MHHISCRVFGETSNHPGGSAPTTAQIWCPVTFGFFQNFFTFEREEISDCWWDSRKYDGATDGDWENCVRSQGAYFEGDWGIIVLLQCFLYLVSSSINVSIFHIKWLDTFWTYLIYSLCLYPLQHWVYWVSILSIYSLYWVYWVYWLLYSKCLVNTVQLKLSRMLPAILSCLLNSQSKSGHIR